MLEGEICTMALLSTNVFDELDTNSNTEGISDFSVY